jgi:hypothetical protein
MSPNYLTCCATLWLSQSNFGVWKLVQALDPMALKIDIDGSATRGAHVAHGVLW